MLAPPIAALEAIDREALNRALIAWEHKMGPWTRPNYGLERFHGLFYNGEMVAVTAAARPIREVVAGGLPRDDVVELGRLCAGRPHLCRPMLRLWREFVFPALGRPWAISYQDSVLHSGSIYRLDGWVRIGVSRSGTDARSGRKGRSKVVWGWSHLPNLRREHAVP